MQVLLCVKMMLDFVLSNGEISCTNYLVSLDSAGRFLSMLPVDPKLGKMLVMGAIFHCLDPILTVVSGLSVRDPFLLPQDKKDVSACN